MALNPNIALAARGVELQDPLAQYGRVMAIQQAGNQNQLAQYQLGAAQRGEARDIARTNALAGAGSDETAIANALLKSGDISAYSAFVKAVEDRKTQRLTQQKTQGEISAQPLAMQKAENELFDNSMKQIRNAWGSVRTPEDAIAIHEATHRDPVINKRLQAFGITEQMGRQQILDAARDPASFAELVKKAQVGAEKFMEMNKPVTSAQDTGAGGRLISRPGLGGAATVVPGSEFTKQMAPGEQERINISRDQLRTSQGQLSLAQQKFAFEKANPGFELQQTEDGSFVGINKRTLQAIPVTMGGATPTAPAAAPTAPGAGMPGPRMPAPVTQVIPGMTSVLDQPAAAAAVAPGSPVKGAPKNKDISVSEQQASYNIARVLNAADEIGKITKKDPKALAPGGMEAALKSTGLEGAANLARSTNRQIVNGAQRDALDALLYLATGAAYNKEQLQGAFEAYIPSYTDDTGTREAKQARMTSLIQDAKIRAGKAWTPKMDAAMTSLTGSTKPAAAANIPAPKGVDSSLWNVMTPEERKLWQPK
jgi:hypothetical protein